MVHVTMPLSVITAILYSYIYGNMVNTLPAHRSII